MTDFDWHNPYPGTRKPVFARNIVATSQPLAAQAGLRMLLKGGSAVDATIAAAAALTIVEPVSNGLGGDAMAILWDGRRLVGLNASGAAPAAWSLEYFRDRYVKAGDRSGRRPRRGWDTVTVPGAIAGWAALHERYGRLPFADLLEPAIELASRGYAVGPIVAPRWAASVAALQDQPGFAEAFMPKGRAPATGERFRFPAAADTLRRLARDGPRSFYEGEIGETIAAFSRSCGAALTLADLQDCHPDWVAPIHARYRGYELHETPPSTQGIAALMAIRILDKFDIANLAPDGIDAQHLQIEAMKLAFADVDRYVADPRAMAVTPREMLDDAYLDARAKLIDRQRATNFGPGTPKVGGTVYVSAADERGMMVSFIQSNYVGFGSGVVVPGTGISLQNRGCGFSMIPASPNVVAGGKRPFHTIIPAFLTRDGAPVMSFGVMGGEMQPQAHVQTCVRMLDHRQQPQAACDAPRWKIGIDSVLYVEATMPRATIAGLAERGHRLKVATGVFGQGQFVWRLSQDPDDGYVAASDSRAEGCAVGF